METKTKQQVEHLRNHLKQLSNFSSWHIIRDELQSDINTIEQMLFTTDPKKNEKLFTQHDIQRAERNLLKMFVNLPSTMFEELEQYGEIKEEDL